MAKFDHAVGADSTETTSMIGRLMEGLQNARDDSPVIDTIARFVAYLIALSYPFVTGFVSWLVLSHLDHGDRLTKIEASRYTIEMGAVEQRERIEADAAEERQRVIEDMAIRKEATQNHTAIMETLHGIDTKVTRLESRQ